MSRSALAASSLALLLLLALAPSLAAAQGPTPDWTKVKATRIATELAFPADIDIAPDGSIWYTEKMRSNITRLDPATGKTQVMWHAPDAVEARDERGMVGLALDPDFAQNGVFYVFYTQRDGSDEGGVNRLLKFVDGRPTPLLDGITAWQEHNGGKVVFGPDKTLFVSVGENAKGEPAQDLDSLLGKVLHLTRDGQPATGNIQGFVYSLGHRNPYGLAVDPRTSQVYANENSGWQRDEVNLVKPGGNYGYPVCEGFYKVGSDTERCPSQYEPPLGQFTDNSTVAPVGMVVWRGDVYWATWNQGNIHRIRPPAEGPDARPWVDQVVYKPSAYARMLDLEVSPDGRALYYSTMTDIWRLDFPGLEDEPAPTPSPTPPGTITAGGPVPLETPRNLPAPGVLLLVGALALLAAATRRR